MERNYPVFYITEKARKSVASGHPWVYTEEITNIEGDYVNGDIVDVRTSKGKYLGSGFVNMNSKIGIRIISRNANDTFDDSFFKRRVQYAIDYRKTVQHGDLNSCRLIFGEADFFPGMTVDKFNNLLVTQVMCLGIEQRKELIYNALIECLNEAGFPVEGIYERNDVALREKEGLKQYKGWYFRNNENLQPVTTINENGILYEVDVENGQKTGYFLDQRVNRALVGNISLDKTVLECFTHTGSFGLNAAKGGAKKVVSVDISALAIEQAKKNAEMNKLDHIVEYRCANVFDLLDEELKTRNTKYDLIILDPPAFTKSKKTVHNATEGYFEINYKAMKLLPRGGYLATCSCSHFMKDSLFKQMIHDAATKANVQLRQISVTQQGPDHPILWNVPETDYLKFYIFQIV